MKKLFFLSIFLLFLTACGQAPEIQERFSYLEVVDHQEDASLSEIEDIDLILRSGEVIVGLENANEAYSRYNFEQTPAYVIFEYTGYLTDDMILFTYEQEEAITHLEQLIQQQKEKEE
ncbi:hypothetical protein [Sutcliffiella halmapala]|uniref:hypothetical protein n=1 Tax=Sutcliffiella halmapala TaxID=79882 RepID=UPI000994EC53|nr:hypothetical protein [Sutcliffiella halmapala]